MAGLSRAKAASIQILRTAELKASECKRPAITQFHARTARSQVAAQVAAPRPRAGAQRPRAGLQAPLVVSSRQSLCRWSPESVPKYRSSCLKEICIWLIV